LKESMVPRKKKKMPLRKKGAETGAVHEKLAEHIAEKVAEHEAEQ